MRVILYVYRTIDMLRVLKVAILKISALFYAHKISDKYSYTQKTKKKEDDGNMHRRMLRPSRIARAVPFALFIQAREETHALDLVLFPVRGTRFAVRSRGKVRASVGSRQEEETRARATTRERRRERGRRDEEVES
jgi:hypothetical protein